MKAWFLFFLDNGVVCFGKCNLCFHIFYKLLNPEGNQGQFSLKKKPFQLCVFIHFILSKSQDSISPTIFLYVFHPKKYIHKLKMFLSGQGLASLFLILIWFKETLFENISENLNECSLPETLLFRASF